MYTPPQFKVEDIGEAHALMRARPFADARNQGADGLTATHLPTVLKTDGRLVRAHRMPPGAPQPAVEDVSPETSTPS